MEQDFQDLAVFETDDQIIVALDFGTTVGQRHETSFSLQGTPLISVTYL